MSKQQTFQVKCYLSQDELDCIKNNAKECGIILSGYIREAASNFCIFKYDHDAIFNHTKEISRLNNDINRLICVMRTSPNYFSLHGEYLLRTMKKIREHEGEFLSLMLDDVDKKRSVIEREVKRSVRRRLIKEGKYNEKRD